VADLSRLNSYSREEAGRMRIISLVPSHTETLFYLDLGEQLVGVTEHCDFPPEAGHKERVGYFGKPDLIKIAALKPDLVVAGGSIHRAQVGQLRQSGIEVFDFQPDSVNSLLDGMEALLRIAPSATGVARVAALRKRKQRLEELGRKNVHRLRLAFLVGGSVMHVPGPANWQYDAFRLCGTQPLSPVGDDLFIRVDWDDIQAFDPEIILACGHGSHERPPRRCPGCTVENRPCARDIAAIRDNPALRGVAAVQSDRVYPVACHRFCRPGPRLFEGMEWLVLLCK
jgi:iron complex transport system substrate-binding protein